ncbi:rhodanese-like domain-containing protein [Lentzea sp. PSKA42]|uniref:Rhodanese-like domain-containing protein n=1 Tax=Lentzea indica TaxID=2604800 RepID=A0ABX1FYJ2_9PSEU|nr:rhodanese-like domain-containing protein [Lentzea indica]NKE64105.1 rhodanese-like domain-containing protein [Lentzea indica]
MTRHLGTVDGPSLQERLDAGIPAPRLIDVRTSGEFEAGHIRGAVNVPLDVLKERLDDLCPLLRGQDVVLVCRSGQRAGQAQEALAGAGLGHSEVLAGGIVEWERAGGELDRGRQVWELERQVRFVAGGMVLAAVLASVAVPQAKWLAALIGGGLVVAALSNTCALGMALARMPWNRRRGESPIDRLIADR